MRRIITTVTLAAMATLAGCANVPYLRTVTPPVVDEAPVESCPTGEVTILHGQAVDCDLHAGNTLTEMFTAETEGPEWGTDATVMAAAAECDDMGGVQVWLQQPYRLACTDRDF